MWMTALLFFMVALAVGYVYALGIARLPLRIQLVVHGVVSVATIVLIFLHSKIWSSGITPAIDDIASFTVNPTVAVFSTLAITIGLPFVLLSSTSSLLQWWYAQIKNTDPSSLYSVSNSGSLLGLLSYPIIIEPLLNTGMQGMWWTAGMAMYLGFLTSIMWLVYQFATLPKKETVGVPSDKEIISQVTKKAFVVWMLVASVPVMVLLSGTSFMTTAIAPVPFLWVGPLALYLVSFIWSFRAGRTAGHPVLHEAFVFTSVSIAFMFVVMGIVPVLVMVLTVHIASFSIFHWCHEYLYATKPHERSLPAFYVALAVGGIVGSVVIKISSAWILDFPIEFMIILLVSMGIVLYRWFPVLPDFFPSYLRERSVLFIAVTASMILILLASHMHVRLQGVIAMDRNFYGYKAVNQYELGDGTQLRTLQHGMTNHGSQIIRNGESHIQPVSYYGYSSGVGKVFQYFEESEREALSVMVIGLGTGVLAAYCTPDDSFTFIEIDPEIVSIAQEYFSFLEACSKSKVVVADGRLALTQTQYELTDEKFDVIVIDAYADDMIPIHLLTKEAVAVYTQRLAEGGFIAIHISSRYLHLAPVVLGVAMENKLLPRYVFDGASKEDFISASQWVLLTREADEVIFSHPVFDEAFTAIDEKPAVWTDAYSALLPIIKLW